MADQNSYLRYKRETNRLLYWMIHASNNIIKSAQPSTDAALPVVNTTGQLTVSALVSISKLIANHVNPIPSTIYSLFQSVIAARSAAHSLFQQIVTKKPDPEIERSNLSHRKFIDALIEAFEALGGRAWESESKAQKSVEEDEDNVIFANKFSALNVHESKDKDELELEQEDEDDEDNVPESEEHPAVAASRSVGPKKSAGKGKKGKKGKRGKKAKSKKPATIEVSLDDIPLESYRIIDNEGGGLITDYLIAVYSLVEQWVKLRHDLQEMWREVSYEGLNGAVAGALSNVAVAMVKQTQSAIFVDFPGHDSYETVMKTITRGDPEKAQGNFHLTLHRIGPGDDKAEKVQETDIDVKEQFMIHTYWNLLDFITDFQHTHSGKPTKRVLAEIRDWDPNFDLQQATKEQRMKWRRAYTINWLYDLVNVFSAIVVQRNTMKGQNWKLDTIDWSVNGPWNEHRRLFGLNEFAGEITTLAMQKAGTNIRQRILPHTVFQLCCIVDSLTVSRGWSLNTLRGHILAPPAPGYRPRRDVDLFLDRKNERIFHGYCHAVDTLVQFLENDSMVHGTPTRHENQTEMLKLLRDDFVNWLGESMYMHGLTTIPPSRFSSTNSNGLWEYSPSLCGVGLMEALELTYGINFMFWDRMPEPVCVIHLHNMLVQKGYISEKVGLYASLQQFFKDAFFVDGKVPTSDFVESFAAVCNETGSRRAVFQRRALRRNIGRTAVDLHGIFDTNANIFFKQKSLLMLYRKADWLPEKIPDEEVNPISMLGTIRIGQTKLVKDPATSKMVFENSPIISRARSFGMDEATLLNIASASSMLKELNPNIPESLLPPAPEGEARGSIPQWENCRGASDNGILNERENNILDLLKYDLIQDVCGEGWPLSSLNYVWVTIEFMLLFSRIEDELKRLRNPLWVRAYEEDPLLTREKRASLTMLALAMEDDECLRVMAEMFENPRAGWMQHIYWGELDDKDKVKSFKVGDVDDGPSCTVM